MAQVINFGIDLGGTKTELIALCAQTGAELWRQRVATKANDYAATLSTIHDLVASAERELGQTGTVGIGMPGAICPQSGLVKNANSTWLIGRDLAGDLQRCLGREVRIANDADCFALSEATDGAGQGQSVVFGVILGTGVGGGLVVHGRLVNGPNAISGEWGHNTLVADGPACYCGRQGCVECFVSGPALERRAALEFPDIRPKATQLAEMDHPKAKALMDQYEDYLARALAQVINIIDPHVIILGGGLGKISRLYENVPKIWGKYVFSPQVVTKLVAPKYGDSSGVRGAAWLWK